LRLPRYPLFLIGQTTEPQKKALGANQLTIFNIAKFHDCRHPDCIGDDLAESPYLRDQIVTVEETVQVDVISKACRPEEKEKTIAQGRNISRRGLFRVILSGTFLHALSARPRCEPFG